MIINGLESMFSSNNTSSYTQKENFTPIEESKYTTAPSKINGTTQSSDSIESASSYDYSYLIGK